MSGISPYACGFAMAASRNFELLTTVPAAIAKPFVMRSWRVNEKKHENKSKNSRTGY